MFQFITALVGASFSGRVLSDDGPKYINSPETLIFKKEQPFRDQAGIRN